MSPPSSQSGVGRRAALRGAMRRFSWLVAISLAVTWLNEASRAGAEDVVYVLLGEQARLKTRLTGEVLDYTGETLLLRLPGNVERAYPASRVVAVEPARSPANQAADRAFASRDFAAASTAYRQALDQEERRWVRRELMARLVWCFRNQDDLASAVQLFVLLLESDPATPHFSAIPLTWMPREISDDLTQRSLAWLARADLPAVQLIGASCLLSGPQRATALERLQTLSFDRDPRIAGLARAQVWRTSLATANSLQVEGWQADLARIPEPLRAGPHFLLGQAWTLRNDPEQAAWNLMRVVILHPDDSALVSRSLLDAARLLEKMNQAAEARTLYQELVDRHGRRPEAAEARNRLTALVPGNRAAGSP